MSVSKHITDNILLSGYLREHEQALHVQIPKLITTLISVYCKLYCIKTVGSLKEPCSNLIDSSLCTEYKIYKTNSNNLSTAKQSFIFDHIFAAWNATIPQKINDILDSRFIHHINGQIIDIQYGEKHALFLTSCGNVYAFGSNEAGQCGLGPNIQCAEEPMLVAFESGIKSIACGDLHSLFINEYGELLVCGYNYCGQLAISKSERNDIYQHGYPETDSDVYLDGNIEKDIEFEINTIRQQDGDDAFVFIDDSDDEEMDDDDFDDTKYCSFYEPIFNPYFKHLDIRFIDIDCGSYHSLAITTNGECYTFGHNGFGNLGNGACTEWGDGIDIPYKLDINKKFVAGSCGNNHNVLITEQNEMVVFGDNTNKQCSVMDIDTIKTPLILSKQKEFEIADNCYIEKVICMKNKSLSIIDVYKRF